MERDGKGGIGRNRSWDEDSEHETEYMEHDEEDDDDDEYNDDDDENDDEEVNYDAVRTECLSLLSQRDFIMEPIVLHVLKRYFQAGGAPESVIQLLSDNYTAVAQTVNLLAEWLIQTGVGATEVQDMVENHFQQLIIKNFDPKKADSIFSEGETPSWLDGMIAHPTWRRLIYKLSEEYPECVMLNFTVKLISDAGYQGEITNVSTACHQIDVFSRVLRTSLKNVVEGGENSIISNIDEFTSMVCHGEHTYIYAMAVMERLSRQDYGGSVMRRISQEVQNSARNKQYNVTQLSQIVGKTAAHPRVLQALVAMLSKGDLNPADISVLHKQYTSQDPPPVELIRDPYLLDLFMKSLFDSDCKINPDYKEKYIYLLSYACSVHETWKKGERKILNKDEVKVLSQAVDKVHNMIDNDKGGFEIAAEIPTLYNCLRFPVIGMGVLYWVNKTVTNERYFELNTNHTPIHLVLLDEVVNCHSTQHGTVMKLLIRLFESPFRQLDVLVQMELKKTILDRMIHLLSKGYVVPVISYISKCIDQQDTDISLIRHFVMEVLDMVAPPYTESFIEMFLPMIENETITGTLRNPDGSDVVSEFIAQCRAS